MDGKIVLLSSVLAMLPVAASAADDERAFVPIAQLATNTTVLLPTAAPGFTLKGSAVDPASNGVTAQYAPDGGADEVLLLIRLSPIGRRRIPYAEVPDLLVRSFESGLEHDPAISHLKPGKPRQIVVTEPWSYLRPPAERKGSPSHSQGLVHDLSYTKAGHAVNVSAAHFFRNMFAAEVIAYSGDASKERVDKLVVDAANAILPAIELRNLGPCDAAPAPSPYNVGQLEDNCATPTTPVQPVPPRMSGIKLIHSSSSSAQ